MLQAQPISEKGKTRFYDLFIAVQAAAVTEARFGEFVHENPRIKKDNATFDGMARLASVTLPETFGLFIATLDLQNAFLKLGRYVRSFGDAEYVLDKLRVLIIEWLSNSGDVTENDKGLWTCCREFNELFLDLMNGPAWRTSGL